MKLLCIFFFFQAEDGIRDYKVTGVQTCALPIYVPDRGRRVFTIGDLTFGIAICHEAFRYPEIARSLALAGAQVVFVPHFVTTDDGSLPVRWCDAANPYNEKAVMCRALENGVFVAAANAAGPDQGSITGIIDPDGSLVASL